MPIIVGDHREDQEGANHDRMHIESEALLGKSILDEFDRLASNVKYVLASKKRIGRR